MGMTLRKGQRLRPRHPALAAREWGIDGDAVGTVLCCYRVEADPTDRVDVAFAAGRMAWGAPAAEFALVPDARPADRHPARKHSA